MTTLLWTLQIVLAAIFTLHGVLLTLQPASRQDVFDQMPFSKAFLRIIGIAELLGAAGLILPIWLGIAPILTPLAATGLAVIVVSAATFHARNAQTPQAIVTSFLAVLAIFVAIIRF